MVKRIFDIIFSITVLLLISPVFLVISILIYMTDGKPVFFTQKRSGLDAIPFNFTKFRTMKIETSITDSERITNLGGFLRKTSLDEFPSLWNVLKGDMSLVGPRPLLMEYLDRYSHEQAYRHNVKPGITGLAQIKGRNSLSWDEKFSYDVYYVDNQNVFLDIKIILITIYLVFTMKGISPNNQEIMPEFTGSDINESFNKTKPK